MIESYKDRLGEFDLVGYAETLKLIGGSDPYELVGFAPDVTLLLSVSFPDIVNIFCLHLVLLLRKTLRATGDLMHTNSFWQVGSREFPML